MDLTFINADAVIHGEFRKRIIKLIFLLNIILLPIDGFLPGILVLREFGSRPTSFLLLCTAFFFTSNDIKQLQNILKPYHRILLTLFILGSINIVVIFYNGSGEALNRSPITNWLFQYIMLLWFFLSLFIWIVIFSIIQPQTKSGYSLILKSLLIGATFNIIIFIYEYAFGRSNEGIFYIVKGLSTDSRPSALSTEPSLFGGWVAFVWPIFFFNKSKYGIFYKILSIIVVACGIISGARTLLIILLLQVSFIIYFSGKSKGAIYKILIVGATLLTLGSLGFIQERLTSTFNYSENLSSMSRFAATLAAFRAYISYPIFGIGLGQFTYYFTQYVPDWALLNAEIQSYIMGAIDFRINTYNLLVRIAAECGSIFLIFFIILFYKTCKPCKLQKVNNIYSSYYLSMIGACSWWLSQDLFSYQVGLISLAAIIYINSISKNSHAQNYYIATTGLKSSWWK